jgi:hypothetical protein
MRTPQALLMALMTAMCPERFWKHSEQAGGAVGTALRIARGLDILHG